MEPTIDKDNLVQSILEKANKAPTKTGGRCKLNKHIPAIKVLLKKGYNGRFITEFLTANGESVTQPTVYRFLKEKKLS